MKKVCSLIVLLSLLFTVFVDFAHAVPVVQLFLDGEPLPSDVPPTIVNGRTLVPLRVVGEALGAEVVWRSNSLPILVARGNDRVEVQIGKQIALVNGKEFKLDVAPRLINDRAMVPFRFIGESLGAGVYYQSSPPRVYITSPTGKLGPAELEQTESGITALSFQASRAMDIASVEVSEDGQEVTVLVNNVVAEPESRELSSGQLVAYSVTPVGKNSTQIRVHLGEGAKYLLPQAALSADQLSLTISWPLGLKEASLTQSGGIEFLSFALPESVKPEVTDTTLEVEEGSSLPGYTTEAVGVRVRSGPSTDTERITTLPLNTRVDVIGVVTGWYQVRLSDGTEGWIADWLLAVETEIEEKVGVNVRKGPSTNSARLTTLYPGHKIRVLSREEGWCYVEYGAGKQGYIADWLVPLESRLVDSYIVPGLTIFFPGVSRAEQVQINLTESNHVATASWKEDESGATLALQLKKPISHRLAYTDQGWCLTFGTWLQQFDFESSQRGLKLHLALDGPSQPTAKYTAADEAIIVTIPGAALAPGIKTSLPGDGIFVSDIRAEQAGGDVRLVVSLTRPLAYHLQKNGESTWDLVIASPSLAGKIVAIDPGHGATDPGAMGTLGWNEKDYTHDIAYRLRSLLEQAGAKAVMTREIHSSAIQGPARAAIINQAGADLFISIHINSSTNTAARGIETWYYPRGDNERFARLVQDSLVAELGWPDRGIKPGRYIIVRDALTTGVMAEIGFISNRTDEALLYQSEIRQRIARALFTAAESYFEK
ncbi:MAG: SH3 domain-containing protein [Firmicutes bacterium]|nr:SH3 domain-containing protein [Bacillota bacterium]